MAATQATKEAVWLRALLADLEVTQTKATTIFEDNQGAIAPSKNPVHHARTKHIDIQWHYVREKTEDGTVSLVYLDTEQMIADVLTKPLSKIKIARFVELLGLRL
jgi:hypothetical protein